MSQEKTLLNLETEPTKFFVLPHKNVVAEENFDCSKEFYPIEIKNIRIDSTRDKFLIYSHDGKKQIKAEISDQVFTDLANAKLTNMIDKIWIGVSKSTSPKIHDRYQVECLLTDGSSLSLVDRRLEAKDTDILSALKPLNQLDWTRSRLQYGGHKWVLDRFANGLAFAYQNAQKEHPKPAWCGPSVRRDVAYQTEALNVFQKKQLTRRTKGARPTPALTL